MNKKYKINVIIPVYNTEKYLSATLKSLINQSIGFSNILVILVTRVLIKRIGNLLLRVD